MSNTENGRYPNFAEIGDIQATKLGETVLIKRTSLEDFLKLLVDMPGEKEVIIINNPRVEISSSMWPPIIRNSDDIGFVSDGGNFRLLLWHSRNHLDRDYEVVLDFEEEEDRSFVAHLVRRSEGKKSILGVSIQIKSLYRELPIKIRKLLKKLDAKLKIK